MVCSFRKDKYVAKKFNGIYRGRSFPVSDFPGGIKVDKNEVIQITLNLIKEKKLEEASVGEIIKIMNTSAGSLYYYFKSKNEIYEKITEYIFVEIDEVLKEVLYSGRFTEERKLEAEEIKEICNIFWNEI